MRRAAELARQRPLRAAAVHRQAAEHARAWRGPCQLVQFRGAVECIEVDPERVRPGDVASRLIVLPKQKRSGAMPSGATVDLAGAGEVEAGAFGRQGGNHRNRGIGLHGVIDAGVRQQVAQRAAALPHRFQIDDHARRRRRMVREEPVDPRQRGGNAGSVRRNSRGLRHRPPRPLPGRAGGRGR